MSETLENATFHLDTDPFPDKVRIARVRAIEALDEPYRAEIHVVVHEQDGDVTELLGTDCVLRIVREPLERRLCGLVLEVHEGLTGVATALPRAHLVVGPALALLQMRRNTRMFQEQTVPQILETVLSEALSAYSREVQLELDEEYKPREYCLQYQESDLDFVHRLMEEEGIYYAFDHQGEREILILRDRSSSAPRITTEPAGGSLELHRFNAVIRDQEPIVRFSGRHRPATTSVALRDHEWTRDALHVEGEERGEDAQGVDREVYEHGIDRKLGITEYDSGARRYQSEDSARQATLRLEAHTQHTFTAEGVSRVTGMIAGGVFELTGHDDPAFDQQYLITRVVHENERDPSGDHEDGELYHNRFWCIPLDVPHRPTRRTRRPIIESFQTAVVTGPSGEEIHTDEHGRIKVQFHWDRENPADETSSCWIRVKQEWAGAGWGFWWVPRIGMEVVVRFIDGDPDRPLVTGAVYDGQNPLPYPLPDEKTKSTIKSNSSLGGGGSNEFRFEDKAGSEEIFTHAQKDYNEVVENDHNTLVHANQTNEVDGDQTQTIHVDQEERVDGTQTMSVGGNRTVHVEGNFDETVDANETRHTAGNVSETFSSTETRNISGAVTEDVTGNETRTLAAGQTETIGASRTRTVTGSYTDNITGSLTETVTGGITSTTPATHEVTATGGWMVNAPGGIKINAQGGADLTQAGGMTRVDFEWRTQADEEKTNSFISLEFYVTKCEAVNFHYVGGTLRVAMGASKEVQFTKSKGAAAVVKAIGTYIGNTGLYNRFRQKIRV